MTKRQLSIAQCHVLDDLWHCNLGSRQLRFYIQVGDCGPDQAAMRVDIAFSWKQRMLSVFMGFACMAHQVSLGECRVVALTDVICTKCWGLMFNYFCSSLKINHVFRESNDAVMRSATRHVGDNPQLVKCIKTKPGKSNTCRWGAICKVERYYLNKSNDIVQHIMDSCFFHGCR